MINSNNMKSTPGHALRFPVVEALLESGESGEILQKITEIRRQLKQVNQTVVTAALKEKIALTDRLLRKTDELIQSLLMLSTETTSRRTGAHHG